MRSIIEILHTAPLFFIALLYIINSKYAMRYGFIANIVRSLESRNGGILGARLVLAAIGVAFGANSHHAGESIAFIIDPCLIYASVIISSAAKVNKPAKKMIPIKIKR